MVTTFHHRSQGVPGRHPRKGTTMPNELPIDSSQLGIMLQGYSKPKIGYNSTEQELDRRTGLPLWLNSVVRFEPQAKQLEIIRFVVASREDPAAGIEFGTPITLDGVRYSSGTLENGRAWSKYLANRISVAKK